MVRRTQIFLLIGGILLAVVSFLAGSYWGYSNWISKSEEVVGAEITLLEDQAEVPDCAEIRAARNGLNTTEAGGTRILWRYDTSADVLKKVIVTEELEVAYEEKSMRCD
jgi:hypothetical protein